jgi:hypothetical protein
VRSPKRAFVGVQVRSLLFTRARCAATATKPCKSRGRLRMKYNKFQKTTSVPVSASESLVLMVNLANRRERTRRCLHGLFQRGTKVSRGWLHNEARLDLKQCQALRASSGSILFLTKPIEFVSRLPPARTKSVEFFLPEGRL